MTPWPALKSVAAAALVAAFFACAPRAVMRPAAPIPADTPPERILSMVRASEEGIKGLRASVRVTVEAPGKGKNSFDGVLYAQRPDKMRLTGLAMLGFTLFDAVINGDTFYFYRPSEGYLYRGPRKSFASFLLEHGVDVDPETVYHCIFFNGETAEDNYLVEKTADGYSIYCLTAGGDKERRPEMKALYDSGLNLTGRVFYDADAKPYLHVGVLGRMEAGGFSLPGKLEAKDERRGYTVTVEFEKYVVNPPDGMDSDFTIQGGELKGILKVE